MRTSLDSSQRMQLDIAIFKLNMVAATTASEAPAHPSATRIKNKIAGLTAEQIIALADKATDVKLVGSGQQPGIPSDLMQPLPRGPVVTPIGDTVWHFKSNTDGHIAHATVAFDGNGTVRVSHVGAKPRSTAGSGPNDPIAGTYVVRDQNGSVRDPRTGVDTGSGTWVQSADALRISLNDGFAILVGRISGDRQIVGKDGNKFGVTWAWQADEQ